MRSPFRRTDFVRPVPAGLLVLFVLTALPAPPVAAQGVEEGRTVVGVEGVQTRNDPIRLGEGSRVEGPIVARNGSVAIGAGSEVRSVSSRNGSIVVGANSVVAGGVDTRNGRIELADGAFVAGPVESRNGRIELGDDVWVEGSVETRNGRIRVGDHGGVAGDVRTRNGAVSMQRGSRVEGSVATRNGAVRLDGARVSRDVEVEGGDLDLLGDTRVEGDVVVLMHRTGPWSWLPFFGPRTGDPSVVRIGPDARIDGRLIVDERIRLEVAPGALVPEPERVSR
jgi:hypothetical protein